MIAEKPPCPKAATRRALAVNDKINPVRTTDDEARALAKALLKEARFASLAFTDPATGGPSVSRIIIADLAGHGLVTLISDLSAHARALALDRRCALLIGEPGKGDPLAHPRMSVIGHAMRLPQTMKDDTALVQPFLEMHPKTKLYFSFLDFAFWQFSIERVDLNGGFGKAYQLTPDDLR
jgi:putative heme iron utilization protein